MNSELRRKIYMCWYNMMRRCYNKEFIDYKYYGAKGVTVCEYWHEFDNFVIDFIKIGGYTEEGILNGTLNLDKDFSGQHLYSIESCKLISKKLNNHYRPGINKYIEGISPDGNSYIFYNQLQFASQHNLNQGSISACVKGNLKTHKKWVFRYL